MTATVSEAAVAAIEDASDLAEGAARDLARADEASKSAGMATTIEKFTTLAQTKALVSIAQSLVIIASTAIAHVAQTERDTEVVGS